jgi:hypothetical protein
VVLAGLGFWLILDGVLSIVKYPKQTFPEQLIRVTRAIDGIIIIEVEKTLTKKRSLKV